jgi:hypothetical protein
MSSLNTEERKGLFLDIPLDEGYAHVLIEYDRERVSLPKLLETIEMTGARVIETRDLRPGKERNRAILLKLDAEDVREVILNLSKYPLVNVTGYNSKNRSRL